MIQQDTAKLNAGGVVSDRAIYVDVDGNEVAENSPKVHAQLYGAGAVVGRDDAKRFGLLAGKAGVVGKDAPAPENKSGVPQSEETKTDGGGKVIAVNNTPPVQPERKGKGK